MNAVRKMAYIHEGLCEEKKGTLTIQTLEENHQSVIGFQDTGTVISREIQKRMFEPFFTTQRENKGTGLGLFISQKILKEHGSKIEIQSKEGKGTTVILYFPLAMPKTKTSSVKLKNSEEHLLC